MATFWKNVSDLRKQGLIPREWRSGQLSEFLERPRGPYAPNTISSNPQNYSISMEETKIGNSVKKGSPPKVWRVAPGQFRLIEDPEDDMPTQESERSRARERAEEFRSQEERPANDRWDEPPNPLPSRPDLPTPPAEPVPGSPDLYPSIPIPLTSEVRQYLASLRTTEKKAEAIILMYLVSKYGRQAEIEEDQDGADLRITLDGNVERIEVKGTESSTLAWSQLKVSSPKSHDALVSGDASIYRVVDVNGESPRIYVLTHGRHFTLEPEPRWAVRRAAPKDDRYPLRGEPYGYERPYDPVAEEDWKALK